MGHAYTPGLKISKRMLIQKKRQLPIKGNVLVQKQQKVESHDIVATAELPGNVHILNIVNILGIIPGEIRQYLVKKEKDKISKGEPIAMTRPIIPWFKTVVKSPIDGIIESVSEITGQILLREPNQKLELKAYIDGIVTDIFPSEGVFIETYGAFIQGIFGIGGETTGCLSVLARNPEDILSAEKITKEHRGRIIVGGSYVTSDVWQKAKEVGVSGIIVGGVEAYDIKKLLGYELGVAITGMEDVGFTLIVTEGFGRMPMAHRTYELLASLDGQKASMCGATQIRAGVIRPEVIICEQTTIGEIEKLEPEERRPLCVGDVVRIIRAPYFGKIGRAKSLPNELLKIETESNVRVLEVEFQDGSTAIVPRANVEILEE